MKENSTSLNVKLMDKLKQKGSINTGTISGFQKGQEGNWYRLPIEDVFIALATSAAGLSTKEACQRLVGFGPNRLADIKKTSPWIQFLLQFHNPLIYVLLGAGFVTAILGEWIDSGVILGVAVVNAIIGFIQEAKAERAIESLRQMLAPSAMVLREGKKRMVSAIDLVPGDIIILQSGDKVPADVRWITTKNIQVDEAALTGESLPVEKVATVLDGDLPVADRTNLSFSGTLVTSGTGMAVVVATGAATELGKIAGMLGGVIKVETPLMKRLARFSTIITAVILVACSLLVISGTLLGKPLMEIFMVSVALAVSAIPEGLPAIMTVALAIGVKRMVTRNAIIRRLHAVETLGSTTVICTDKTGTLTRNEMTVTAISSVGGDFRVEGAGYIPLGSILSASGNKVDPERFPVLRELMRAGSLCNESALTQENEQWKIDGDPTEGSLVVLARKGGLDVDAEQRRLPRTDIIPFESEHQFMATLHHDHVGNAFVYLKGAPEKILPRCDSEWRQETPLDTKRWEKTAAAMASQGLRVLALAVKQVPSHQVVLDMKDVTESLVLLGLVGMMDPPRAEAISAVKKCQMAGIRIKMITGDHAETARAIAAKIGISDGLAVTGQEIADQSDDKFRQIASEVDVFARVTPAHKLRLVQALQSQGQIVAMTGDGVNDAPALKQADIGIAMGITGTEVSKEAADMVLVDDNFASIEQAIEEGRTVFNNLKKTILFILPTNGGECLTLIAAIVLGAILPILPLHILWINLITTVALAITLAFDPIEPDTMRNPPRLPDAPLIDRILIWRMVFVSVLMSLGTFGLFELALQSGSSLEAARTTAVNAIVFFEVFYLLNVRRLSGSVLNRAGLLGNPIVLLGIAAVVLFQVVFTYWPVLNTLFHTAPIGWDAWGMILVTSIALFFVVESEKAITRKITGE